MWPEFHAFLVGTFACVLGLFFAVVVAFLMVVIKEMDKKTKRVKRNLSVRDFYNKSWDAYEFLGLIPRSGEFPEDVVDAARYIYNLKSQYYYSIEHWDYEKLFTKDGEHLTDKKEILKIFTEKLDSEGGKIKAKQVKILDAANKGFIRENKERFRQVGLDTLKHNINNLEANTREAYANYVSYLSSLVTEQAAINQDGDSKIDFVERIEEAMNAFASLTFYGIDDGGRVSFLTSEIILYEKNRSANIDISVPMGRFKIIMGAFTGEVWVKPIKDNLNVDGICHPHVDRGNKLCLGQAHKQALSALYRGDFKSALLSIMAVLHTFNPGSPYRKLSQFLQLYNQIQAAKNSASPGEDNDPSLSTVGPGSFAGIGAVFGGIAIGSEASAVGTTNG